VPGDDDPDDGGDETGREAALPADPTAWRSCSAWVELVAEVLYVVLEVVPKMAMLMSLS
jgi:hypothetical protein